MPPHCSVIGFPIRPTRRLRRGLECEVIIDDVDGGHTEGCNRADQLDAARLEALAEPLRSSQYGKYLM